MNAFRHLSSHSRLLTTPALIFHVLQAVCLLCAGVQLFVGFDNTNLWCVTLVVLTCSLVLQYMRISNPFIDYPLSSLGLLGLLITSMMTSLVAQTTSLIPIADYLRSPLLTYGVLSTVVVVTTLTHWAYRKLSVTATLRDWIATRISSPLLLLEVPSPTALWILGLIGALSLIKGRADTGDAQGKLVQAFWTFSWMPFLIPLYFRELGDQYGRAKKSHWLALAMYAGLLTLVGIVSNTRTLIVAGPLTAVIMYAIFTLQHLIPASRRHVTKIFILATAFTISVVLFAQLATAMVVVRADRDRLSPKQLIGETVTVLFKEREKMRAFQEAGYVNFALGNYNEYYIQNPVLARFSYTKVVDNVLSVAFRMDDRGRDEVWQYTKDHVIFMIPQNVLDALNIKFNKDFYYYSGGDVYRNIESGGMLGSFLTGSIWADLMTLTGWWFPLAVAFVNLCSFLALDALSLRGGKITLVSPVALCMGWMLIMDSLSGDSLAGRVQFILRAIPQQVVLYLVLFGGIRWFLILLSSAHSRATKETPLWLQWYDRSRGMAYRYLPWLKRGKIN